MLLTLAARRTRNAGSAGRGIAARRHARSNAGRPVAGRAARGASGSDWHAGLAVAPLPRRASAAGLSCALMLARLAARCRVAADGRAAGARLAARRLLIGAGARCRPGSAATGTLIRVSFSMSRRKARSSPLQNEIATPAAPARAVRPIRCT